MTLPDRVEPWHALLVVAFLVGSASSLLGSLTQGVVIAGVLTAVLSGLLWAFAVYVFVGTFRNYVTSYAETGGSLWDSRFLAPFLMGIMAAVWLMAWRLTEGEQLTDSLAVGALLAGFGAFVLTMVLVLVPSYLVAGYHEGAS